MKNHSSNSKELQLKMELFKLHLKESFRLSKQVIFLKTLSLIKNEKIKIAQIGILILSIIFISNSELVQKLSAELRKDSKAFITIPQIIYKEKKDHVSFLNDLAMFESSGRYEIVKTKGDYWGRYQIGPIARKELGLSKISKSEFLSNKYLQDGLVTALLIKNKNYLKQYIGQYEGKTIKGIYITQSGLLAGAHLKGHLSVIDFLKSDGKIDQKDGNEVPVSKYIKTFCNYNLNL